MAKQVPSLALFVVFNLFLIPFTSAASRHTPAQSFESDRIQIAFNVIQKFKSKIRDDPFGITKTWSGTDVCNYKGFHCEKVPKLSIREVVGVNFNGYLFAGPHLTLDSFFTDLPDVVFFHANSNNFSGAIPPAISKFKHFYEFDLSNNKFSGGFPPEILGATLLTFLDLRFNDFYGAVPPQLFDMDIITAIFLNNNRFNGQIPRNLGSTPAKYLTFAGNQFVGPIPRSIGTGKTKKTLIEVLFSNNKLSGCLPMEAGLLENAVLFDAGQNAITGPIPSSFGCLAKMEVLNLADNKLYGEIPEAVCKLPNIGNITLQNNFFTRVGPECRYLVEKKVLDVSNNCISGLANQRSAAECANFLKKRVRCRNENLFSLIPCKNNKYLYEKPSLNPHRPVKKLSTLMTYSALNAPR